LPNNIFSTKRKIKHCFSIADNSKRKKKKWTTEDNKLKTALIKFQNFITQLSNRRVSASTEKINMSL